MDSDDGERTTGCHVVAMPYPGRGHVNPMMNLCKLLASRQDDILITFVLTEEWLDLISSEDKPENVRFETIPNVIPSERVRAADFPGFVEDVSTKMEAPFEQLLDRLEPPVTALIADTHVMCAFVVGNRRNIPAASLWPMSATMFSVFHHFDLLIQNQHYPVDLSERGEERVGYIPGISSTRIYDLPTVFSGDGQRVLNRILEMCSWVPKAHYLLFTSVYELEHEALDALKRKFSFPVYTLGPTIPYFNLGDESKVATTHSDLNYMKWLDSQSKASVLYVSLGSFLSVSSAQMDEIAAGLRSSGVRFLWVGRDKASQLQEGCGDGGLVVPWRPNADISYILGPSPNSKKIVEDWKIGWRVKREVGWQNLVTREEISGLVKRFMDLESIEVKEMRKRAKDLEEVCRGAIAKGGSTDTNLDAFLSHISQSRRR
ncbi:UDP-glycosyltransferase 87A2 [Vitis vinifera]|uniref:UDP-glycosyltransferase 87A2 n=1 Tax=Vitis vinifera TaxID=29760 RepID=A0A438FAE4_VITVI|nr:UDP-glycosyltransferase 87A2 [Vitis vinifera]